MSAWAASRAVALRMGSEGEGGRGFASLQRRLPRSKVYGIGFVTVTELDSKLVVGWAGGLREEAVRFFRFRVRGGRGGGRRCGWYRVFKRFWLTDGSHCDER